MGELKECIQKCTWVSIIMVMMSCCAVTISIMEHPRTRNDFLTNNITSGLPDGIEDFNENLTENNNTVSSAAEILLRNNSEEINRDWPIPEFFAQILPSTSFFSASQAEETETQITPNSSSATHSPGILSRLFSNIIVDRPSVFRVQFYNSDSEDGSSPGDDNENATVPNVVFGSPLCLGICVPVQLFSENTSVHFLSDKQYSLFPPSEPQPTPLYPVVAGIKKNSSDHDDENNGSSFSTTTLPQAPSEDDYFEWLSSWLPAVPSFSNIQSIPLPEFPKLFQTPQT